jgi:catechol 2,3-dioxygenase-like lactoylglutathione lyase family enzyme
MNSHELPLANVITLGVLDLERERDFYRRLGWPLVLDTETFVVFELRGALLALFGVNDLARDAQAAPAQGREGIRSAVIIMAERPEQVDELVEQARAAGARVTKEPVAAEFFDGRDATSGRSRTRPARTRSSPPPAARPADDRLREWCASADLSAARSAQPDLSVCRVRSEISALEPSRRRKRCNRAGWRPRWPERPARRPKIRHGPSAAGAGESPGCLVRLCSRA